MKHLFVFLSTLFSISVYSQQEIKLEELKDHIGDSIAVQGIISEVRYLETVKNTPTFLNVGTAYSNQLLTIVIWGDVRNQLHVLPTAKDAGNKVWVAGKLELYKGKPQIVIRNPKQIDIIQDAQKDPE